MPTASALGGPLAFLTKLVSTPPVINVPDYDGVEYRWKVFTFRPALFKIEPYLLLALVFYLVNYSVGKYRNSRKAHAWFDAHLPILTQQFSRPTLTGLIADGNSDFFNFSTGRRNVASLHVVFKLLPRHDLLQTLYHLFWSAVELTYHSSDELELDFKLLSSPNAPSFVWAVVKKDNLRTVKDGRWDLTFTRTTENSAVGPDYSVMSELADVTENLLKLNSSFALAQLINDSAYKPYIRSLSITDQPRDRPGLPLAPEDRERHIILSLSVPPPSKAAVTVPLVERVFKVIDNLDSKLPLRPETKTKLKKVREEADEQIKREAVAEKKDEAEADKQAAKRKAEEVRISKLSAAEQKKLLERDRKRAIRKSQGKVVRK